MSNLDYEAARDEIYTKINAVWAPTGYVMNWPDRAQAKPGSNDPSAKVVLFHNSGGQEAIGHTSAKLWSRKGQIVIQISTPVGEGATENYRLAKLVGDVFEKPNAFRGVWFRETRINEVPDDSGWYKINVISNFEYSERK